MTMAATTISEMSHIGGPLGFGAAARIGRRAAGRGAAGAASPAHAGCGSAAGAGARWPMG
jgi:hypothetical protein